MALHPRFEAIGLGPDDEQVVRSFIFSAKQAGWSSQQIDQSFQWYKAQAPYLDRMTAGERLASFEDFASARGFNEEQVSQAQGWFDRSAAAIETGKPLELPQTPTPQQDIVRRAELEQLMRENPDQYWGDAEAQDELFELLSRDEGNAPAVAASPAGNDRRAQIEATMRTNPSEYWQSEQMQAEYLTLLGGTPDAPSVVPSDQGAAGDNINP